jgi:hypothetical protein
LITHAWFKREPPTVFQLGVELAFHAEEYVALYTPVIPRHSLVCTQPCEHRCLQNLECANRPCPSRPYVRSVQPETSP